MAHDQQAVKEACHEVLRRATAPCPTCGTSLRNSWAPLTYQIQWHNKSCPLRIVIGKVLLTESEGA